jgi:beta-phosphoglucomutase-like phosphatase (HAD superfamily)
MDVKKISSKTPAFLIDLDGTPIDSVYQHVLAWREALQRGGIELAVWRIHRRIGISGGLFVNALLRETGRPVTPEQADKFQKFHAQAYMKQVQQIQPLPGAKERRQCLGFACRAKSPGLGCGSFVWRLWAGRTRARRRLSRLSGSLRSVEASG